MWIDLKPDVMINLQLVRYICKSPNKPHLFFHYDEKSNTEVVFASKEIMDMTYQSLAKSLTGSN